jgi:hypothetical protein
MTKTNNALAKSNDKKSSKNISRIIKKDKAKKKATRVEKLIKRAVCEELGYDEPHKGLVRNQNPSTRSKELREIKKYEKKILEDPEEMLSVLFETCAKLV